MGSPLILERSGIGAADILKRANVKQIVQLEGVGKEYHGERHHRSIIIIFDLDMQIIH